MNLIKKIMIGCITSVVILSLSACSNNNYIFEEKNFGDMNIDLKEIDINEFEKESDSIKPHKEQENHKNEQYSDNKEIYDSYEEASERRQIGSVSTNEKKRGYSNQYIDCGGDSVLVYLSPKEWNQPEYETIETEDGNIIKLKMKGSQIDECFVITELNLSGTTTMDQLNKLSKQELENSVLSKFGIKIADVPLTARESGHIIVETVTTPAVNLNKDKNSREHPQMKGFMHLAESQNGSLAFVNIATAKYNNKNVDKILYSLKTMRFGSWQFERDDRETGLPQDVPPEIKDGYVTITAQDRIFTQYYMPKELLDTSKYQRRKKEDDIFIYSYKAADPASNPDCEIGEIDLLGLYGHNRYDLSKIKNTDQLNQYVTQKLNIELDPTKPMTTYVKNGRIHVIAELKESLNQGGYVHITQEVDNLENGVLFFAKSVLSDENVKKNLKYMTESFVVIKNY